MKKKRLLFVVCLIIAGLGLYLFMKPIRIVRSMDYPISNSYQDMIDQSEYVVYGYFTEFEYEWNMARDENDEPSKIFTTVGKVHDFQIEKVYKGNISKHTIKVNQGYSNTIYYDNTMPDTNDINKSTPKIIVKNELYIEPDLNKKCLLFLNYDKKYTLYYASVEPFIVTIENNGMHLNSNLIESSIKTTSYKDGLKRVEITTQYPVLQDFSNELSYNEFIELFNKIN